MKKPIPSQIDKNKYLIIISLIIIILSNGCQLRSKKSLVISRLQKTAKIATQEVSLSKYVFYNDEKKILPRLREKPSILLLTKAKVKFGVDLTKIRPEDVEIQGDIIRLDLPPVEALNFSMPIEDAEMMDIDAKDWSTKRKNDPVKIDEMLRMAQSEIEKTIEKMNLAKAAEDRTRSFLTAFLEQLGFGAAIITFKTEKEQKKADKKTNDEMALNE